jgi:hypothetical protein
VERETVMLLLFSLFFSHRIMLAGLRSNGHE